MSPRDRLGRSNQGLDNALHRGLPDGDRGIDGLGLAGKRLPGPTDEQASLHQWDLATISNATAERARQALEKQQAAEQASRDLDARTTKEKTNALNESGRLRRAAVDGDRRLRLAGACPAPAGGHNLPGTAGTTSLGDAGTVELAPASGRAVLDIRVRIITDQAALRAAQAHIRNVCRFEFPHRNTPCASPECLPSIRLKNDQIAGHPAFIA